MVKNHSDRERGNIGDIGYSFRLAARVILYVSFLRQDNAFVTPIVGHWLEREIAQWVHYDIRQYLHNIILKHIGILLNSHSSTF